MGMAGPLLQKVLEHGVAVLGQDAFGVELHAFNRQRLVAHAHDFAVLRPGRHFQHLGAGGALDGQRVVAVDRELFRQPGKHALLRGGDDAGLAVHQLLRADDVAAKRRANALVAQAHAQDGQLAGKVLDRSHRDAGLGRRAGAGRNDQAIELPALQARFDLGHGDLVVAEHFHLGAQFAKVLDDVVGEAVVVVDHQESHDPAHLPRTGRQHFQSRNQRASRPLRTATSDGRDCEHRI
jgi:hypothetical protein